MVDKIQIDLTANDDASDRIDDVADKVEKLDGSEAEIEVTADTSSAEGDVKDLDKAADALTKDDRTLIVKAKIDQAQGDLKSLRQDLKDLDDTSAATGKKIGDDIETGSGKAKDAVHGFAGEAITELPGVGDAVGPAGEAIGQVTEGLLNGEIAMGQLVAAAGPLIALTVGFKLISGYFADIAATKAFHTDQIAGFVKLLKEGKDTAGVLRDELEQTGQIKFVDDGDTKDALAAFDALGLKFQDYVTLVNNPALLDAFKKHTAELQLQADELSRIRGTGGTLSAEQQAEQTALIQQLKDRSTVVETVEQKQLDLNSATDDGERKTRFYGRALDDNATSLESVKRSQDRVKKAVDDTSTAIDGLRGNLNIEQAALDFETKMNEALWTVGSGAVLTKQQIIDIKNSIIDAGETAGKTDVQIQAELKAVDDGNLVQVKADTEAWYKQHQITIASKLALPPLVTNGRQNGIVDESGVGRTAFVPDVAGGNVIVNLPTGARGVDVVRQLGGHARRAGRFYGAPVVSRARR